MAPAVVHTLLATLPVAAMSSLVTWKHSTVRVFFPPPHCSEHSPKADAAHCAAQAPVLHALLAAGSLLVAPAVQNELATMEVLEPVVAMHALPVRAWVPPPQALVHVP